MQVQAACQVPWLEEVILDFLEVHGLKEAVSLVKQAGNSWVAERQDYAAMALARAAGPS